MQVGPPMPETLEIEGWLAGWLDGAGGRAGGRAIHNQLLAGCNLCHRPQQVLMCMPCRAASSSVGRSSESAFCAVFASVPVRPHSIFLPRPIYQLTAVCGVHDPSHISGCRASRCQRRAPAALVLPATQLLAERRWGGEWWRAGCRLGAQAGGTQAGCLPSLVLLAASDWQWRDGSAKTGSGGGQACGVQGTSFAGLLPGICAREAVNPSHASPASPLAPLRLH